LENKMILGKGQEKHRQVGSSFKCHKYNTHSDHGIVL
jgi:hypothetical protein